MWRLNWALASFLALKLSTASAKSSDSTWLPLDRPMLQLKNDWKRRKASIVPLNSGSVYNMPPLNHLLLISLEIGKERLFSNLAACRMPGCLSFTSLLDNRFDPCGQS